jgi:protein-S-isoprenylcysteine O-methyltransferase Ste14
MKPYFLTHPIGILYFLVLMTWYALELRQYVRQRRWRSSISAVDSQNFWAVFWIFTFASVVMLLTAPSLVPAAELGHASTLFAVGVAMILVGAALRVWSFETLGKYFTFTVKVSPDQLVVTAGPYRVLRHPGYAGGLLATIGIGVLYGNWVGLATIAVLFTAIVVWRIVVEERALLTTLADTYGGYAAHHKRLVPLVW